MIKKGFTMIELLVVISIIGILAALALVSYTTTQKQARDTERKSDLSQYRTVLEASANNTSGLFPSRLGGGSGATLSTTVCVTDLSLDVCPEDPKIESGDTNYPAYKYVSDGSDAGVVDATKYVLWALLESTSNYWVVCSNGNSGTVATAGWSNPALGVCPL